MFLILLPDSGLESKGIHNPILNKVEIAFELQTLTVYNPTAKQCDGTPYITASNKRIDMKKLTNQEIRWMALSRNLLKRWNGSLNYGDTVRVASGDPQIDGLWIIQDNMNNRYANCGDLLFHSKVRKLGKWSHVKIYKSVHPV